MTASIVIIVAQLALTMVAFYDTSYSIERWQTFLSYQVLNVVILVYNVFGLKRAPWTHNIGCKDNGINQSFKLLLITRESQSCYLSHPSS